MMLRGLLPRTLLLSSMCRRAPHSSMSAWLSYQASKNPNNPADWKSRGLASRPDNWKTEAAQRAVSGRLEARANEAASRTSGERAAANRRTDIIVQAVQASLGGKAELRKAGSHAKHTDTASSDHDYWVYVGDVGVSRAQRTDLRDTLVSMLTEGGWRPLLVLLRETGVRLEYKKGHVDIVFDKQLFNDKIHTKPKPQRFTNNPKARDAVRLIKAGSPQKFKGEAIEKAVIAAQGQEKDQSFDTVALAAFRLLANEPQVKQFRAWLSDGEKYEYDVADDNYDDDER